jgi:hypothetical protein
VRHRVSEAGETVLRRARRSAGATNRPAPPLQDGKLRAIDFAVERLGATSIADLGGVWAVEAGYTFYALSRPGVQRAVLVDTGITPGVRARAASEPRLTLVETDFGSPEVAASVGQVDAVLLFDVLLHQVAPDWDQVLATWASHTRSFIVVNPQLRGGERALRLMDLGPEGYAAHTPRDHIAVPWDRLDEIDPRYGKRSRDVHEYWQWGIPDRALHRTMTELGYHCIMYANHAQWRDVPSFDYVAFVYAADR